VCSRAWRITPNPWSIAHIPALDWAKDLGIPLLSDKGSAEYLFYVGCAGGIAMNVI